MEFQGFQHSFPTFILLVIALALVALSVASYSRHKSIPPLPKVGLIALRGTSFILLLLLFLNPFFFQSKEVIENPRILFLLDGSESASIDKGTYRGEESYQQVLSELKLPSSSQIVQEYFEFGTVTRPLKNSDSLNVSQTETNLMSAILQIQELEDDFDAAVIISDGIITFGRNPIIQASNLSIPLYTIGLGDTTEVKDISVQEVTTNEIGYTNTQQTVEVQIAHSGFRGEQTQVELRNSSDSVLNSMPVSFNTEEGIASLSFEIELLTPGLKQFEIVSIPLNDEWTTENNTYPFSIEVLDNKTRVLHLSFEVHPDVKMVRSILQNDDNIELSTLTWLGSNRFVERELPDVEEMDLLVVHGLPTTVFDSEVFSQFGNKPSVYLQLPISRRNTRGIFQDISILENTGNQLFDVSLVPKAENSNHPILELPEIGYQNVSTVTSSLRSVSTDALGIGLYSSAFQGIETPNVILSVVERGNIRKAQVNAWDWFRMYQSPTLEEREFVVQLFTNLVSWTSNNPDVRKLKISPTKPVFNIAEAVEFSATLYNESGEIEPEGTVEITITDEQAEQRTFTMSNEGAGLYQLSIPTLSSGLYSYTANARKGERDIDTQKGEFLVEYSNSEFISTVRNDALLIELANQTGGTYFTHDNMDEFWSKLNTDEVLQTKTVLEEGYVFPVRSVIWFLIILALLSLEWIGRKYFSLP